jgi:hypothetical protein
MNLRYAAAFGLILLLSGCASEDQFAAHALWPFGNPNAPKQASETAQRALGKTPDVTPIGPQAGDVWPGAVQPMPTLSQIQANANLPLGQAYTPSLPSPYPPGQDPDQAAPDAAVPPLGTRGNLYLVPPGAVPQAVPGDAR